MHLDAAYVDSLVLTLEFATNNSEYVPSVDVCSLSKYL